MYLQDDCQNYIRVLARVSDDEMLVCGTNAYTPLCRRYERNVRQLTIAQILYIFFCAFSLNFFPSVAQASSSFQVRKEFSGKGLSPYDPNHNSTAVYSGE